MVSDPLAPLLDLPGVSEGVDRARSAVDSLLGNRVLRRRSADVSAESSLRGAWASAGLAGADVTLDDMRSGAALGQPVVQGALRAQSAIGALADTWTRAPRQALARLHALAAADLVDESRLGRPSAGTARIDTLVEVLAATSAPAVVVAAVVHGELLSLDAFAPVSGVVARVAVRLTLIERGLDPKSLVVVRGRAPGTACGVRIGADRLSRGHSFRRGRVAAALRRGGRPRSAGGNGDLRGDDSRLNFVRTWTAAPLPRRRLSTARRVTKACTCPHVRRGPVAGPRRLTYGVVGSPRGCPVDCVGGGPLGAGPP